MKKIFALALTAAMVLSLAACGGKNDGGAPGGGPADQSENGSLHDNTASSQQTDPGASSTESSSAPEQPDGKSGAEALLAQAEPVTFDEMAQAAFDDPSNAQELYCGKVLKVEGSWIYSTVSGQELTMKLAGDGSGAWLLISLSEEDIQALEEMSDDQMITIVGITGEELINEGGGASEQGGASLFTMRDEAYLVK